ncbi:hypothetical protein AKI39_22270 [Bordetella sp. H567]|uniref:SDH family Clp fold serine proteinase n=1 Tax=Bordetella sp. H567 TaxID=1697043 RepID=UPI00081D3212|nr:hypothetical protein [Bordetella sp. H567]AOB32881.1 hypothetical protein AKI39_22270 [Bordetella sp. H567]
MSDTFPRTKDLPTQSPLFWVTHKDRYLRQQLIRDIEDETKRDLVVYFTDCDRSAAQIDPADDACLVELLSDRRNAGLDLLLETNGGFTDATEKVCSILRAMAPDLRVIIPRKAKSNGTVIAMCGQTVMMGPTSELGPIDPAVGGIPADFILKAPPQTMNPIQIQVARTALDQTRKLAKQLLTTGMMQGRPPAEIEAVVNKLASRDHFHSHGSVLDSVEATQLGLVVDTRQHDDPLWQKIWLLRTMYAYDCGRDGNSKVFESCKLSTVIKSTQPTAP